MSLSVLMSVYHKEDPQFLRECLASLHCQTVPANEIVLVKDGPLGSELENVLSDFSSTLPIRQLQLEKNVGLGAALRIGLAECRNQLVARMDSDDIALPTRFELQLKEFVQNPFLDIVGGAIAEFVSQPENPVSMRRLPNLDHEIRTFAKARNPLNHMTVMFRRRAVLRAGSYQPFSDFEDYCLWVRMLMSESVFRNLDDVLVLVRVGNGMLARRSGLTYVRKEIAFQNYLRQIGFISFPRSLLNICMRAPVRLAPTLITRLIYEKVLRTS